MINDAKNEAEQRMTKCIESFKHELAKIRTGRAHPSLLEHVMVDYYGNETPLSQVASINIADSRTLSITPWEKHLVPAIEKAIINANLGLNPATAGEVIRVPMPPLSEERRKDLVKVVKSEAENSRVAIRNIRRDVLGSIKDLLKDKSITEDDDRRAQDLMQKITDKSIAEVDVLLAAKEQELLAI